MTRNHELASEHETFKCRFDAVYSYVFGRLDKRMTVHTWMAYRTEGSSDQTTSLPSRPTVATDLLFEYNRI